MRPPAPPLPFPPVPVTARGLIRHAARPFVEAAHQGARRPGGEAAPPLQKGGIAISGIWASPRGP